MTQAMVTGRMDESKKAQGALVLKRNGLNPSQAINLLYDKVIAEGDTSFLKDESASDKQLRWKNAALFVDSLSQKRSTRFDNMTKAEIRMDRLKSRGLV